MTTTALTTPKPNQSELAILNARKAGIERRQAGWEFALSVALLVTAIAAFLVFVFDWRVRKSSKAIQEVQDEIIRAKDAELQLSLREKDVRIAETGDRASAAETKAEGFRLAIATANSEAAKANERSTKAQESLALAEQHAAEANAKAEGFRLDIAHANQRAAEANRTAEQERLARLQLEARLADRFVTADQQNKVRTIFASLKGQTVDVVTIGDSLEISNLSRAITQCLRDDGVLLNDMRPLGGASAKGVLVGVKPDASVQFKQAAAGLVEILHASLGDGVSMWDFEKMAIRSPMTMGSDAGALPMGQSALRIVIGGK